MRLSNRQLSTLSDIELCALNFQRYKYPEREFSGVCPEREGDLYLDKCERVAVKYWNFQGYIYPEREGDTLTNASALPWRIETPFSSAPAHLFSSCDGRKVQMRDTQLMKIKLSRDPNIYVLLRRPLLDDYICDLDWLPDCTAKPCSSTRREAQTVSRGRNWGFKNV